MKKIFLTLCFSFLLSSSAFANSSFGLSKINTLVVHDSGAYVIVVLKSPVASGEGCTSSSELKLKVDHPLFKVMYATLLTALQSQTPVQGWVNGCDGREPILTRLDISK